jgi:hypothetical protein
MSRGLGRMQNLILASLKPAKRAYAEQKFDYIGGAGLKNLNEQSDRAFDKAHQQLEAQSGKTNQPDPLQALLSLVNMHRDAPVAEDEVLVFSGGEHTYLDEGVYDLRATLRYLADRFNKKKLVSWENRDRTANWDHCSYWFVDDSFRVSFYRAARNLVERGLLICCDNDEAAQLRFVSMRPDIEGEYLADDDPLDARFVC